jgi:hypothetical protein
MKKIQVLIVFLFCVGVSAQNITQINSDLNLSDSLTHETEVRIYQGGGITNYSSLFRMFKDKSAKWTTEFYEHFARVDGKTELRTEKQTLKSNNDPEFVFKNLVRSYILELPGLSEIEWKLNARGNVEKVDVTDNGKKIEEYEIIVEKILILDGEGFKVQVKDLNKNNEFEYSNPDGYLKFYPEIDELIYMCEILNLIRTEFGIWKK